MSDHKRLTEDERDTFWIEMDGNLEGSKATAEFLLNLIDDVPEARAALREWLAGVPENEEEEVA